MTHVQLLEQIKLKRSFLCVGLDVDLDKIPQHLLELKNPLFAFSKAIIDATAPYAVAYKPNIAFFESYGTEGWAALRQIMDYLNANYPDLFTIADAKRGDIGNTSGRYAKAFFENLGFDAITVAPYMGSDSVAPFLAFEDKHTILLTLTSNTGAADFQYKKVDRKPLWQHVMSEAMAWKNAERLMFVVGATRAEALTEVRQIVPDAFLLVPGVGAQGGSLEAVVRHGMTAQCGLLINSSRGIIYAATGIDYKAGIAHAAQKLQLEMEYFLSQKGIV